MIYVMSDIHGNKRRFDSIMKQINLQTEDTLYVLGDVVDRHPHGGRILRQLMKMPNVQLILGNHEYMMLDALDRPFNEKDWHQEDEHRRYINLLPDSLKYESRAFFIITERTKP